MDWHRPELTEAEVLQAVVEDITALVPGAVGTAETAMPASMTYPVWTASW